MQISTQVGRQAVAHLNTENTGELDADGIVESEFLKKFRAKFVGDTSVMPRPWPRATTNTTTELSSEFTAVFRALFQLQEGGIVPPTGDPGTAKQMIHELVADTDWPNGPTVPVPAPWRETRADTFRRYECVAALMIMMKELDRRGDGGGSEGFPPTRPS
jgi:hypothetical protein